MCIISEENLHFLRKLMPKKSRVKQQTKEIGKPIKEIIS